MQSIDLKDYVLECGDCDPIDGPHLVARHRVWIDGVHHDVCTTHLHKRERWVSEYRTVYFNQPVRKKPTIKVQDIAYSPGSVGRFRLAQIAERSEA